MRCTECGRERTAAGCGCDDAAFLHDQLAALGQWAETTPEVVVVAAPEVVAPVAAAPVPVATALTEGWQADPVVAGQERWFDGVRWTADVRMAAPAQSVMFPALARSSGAVPTATLLAPAHAPAPAFARTPAFAPEPQPAVAPLRWRSPMAPEPVSLAPSGLSFLDRPIVVAGAAALVVVLLLTSVWVARRQGSHSYPSAWDPRVADIVTFVQQERATTFLHPVPVDFLSASDFKRKVGGPPTTSSAGRRAFEQQAAAMRAMGLLSGPVDLSALDRQLVQESVIGVYMPRTGHVYVKGSDLTPMVRVTLAHELTHALQDQRFNLKRVEARSPTDAAVRSLIEADAMRVERDYEQSLPSAEQAAYDAAQQADAAGADVKGIPDVLTHALAFPYVFGPAFVRALVAEGGEGAVDQAFMRPPGSEAEVATPTRYLNGTGPVAPAVPTMPKGATRLAGESQFGQVSMLEVLGERLPFDQAWKAVQGWRGDRVVSYEQAPGKTKGTSTSKVVCVAVNTRLDSGAHAALFLAAAQSWAGATKGTATLAGHMVEMRACDPGTAGAAGAAGAVGATPDPAPFDVLASRAMLIRQVLEGGGKSLSAAAAECTADGVLDRLGPKTMAALPSMANSDSRLPQVTAAVQDAAAGCIPQRAVLAPGAPGAPDPHSSPSIRLDPPLGATPIASAPHWAAPADISAAADAAGLHVLRAEGVVEHIHTHVQVDIDGQTLAVPASIGIDARRGLVTELHTHRPFGVIHVESDVEAPFTLGQFFTEWGHPIGPNHVGAVQWGADRSMHLFINGREISGDPARVLLHNGDDVHIVVARAGVPVAPPKPFDWALEFT